MMSQFLVPHVKFLSKNGYKIDVACSAPGGIIEEVRQMLNGYIGQLYVVRLERSPLRISNYKGLKDLKCILANTYYDIIWTNEPVMGIMTRIAAQKARKSGTKVLYMVHGFHFYKGAPLLNWILFYPVERLASSITDTIATINTQDYKVAKSFGTVTARYIHGIGVDTKRLNVATTKGAIKEQLGINKDSIILLSVGELNKNKNHKVVLKAMHRIQNPTIHSLLCGKGPTRSLLEKMANQLGIADNVHFLGYRRDLAGIMCDSMVYIHPSKREGLPLAIIESMYRGLPIIASEVGGIVDLIEEGKGGYLCKCDDVEKISQCLQQLIEDKEKCFLMGRFNQKKALPYLIDNVLQEVKDLLDEMN